MTADERGLALEIQTMQPRYGFEEEVLARVLLFNFGDDSVLVNSRLAAVGLPASSGEVLFEVVGPDGERVPFSTRVNIGRPSAEDFSVVVPWNCVGRQYDLLSYYDLAEPGTYTVTAMYRNRWADPEADDEGEEGPAWVGSLRAPPVRFEIVESA